MSSVWRPLPRTLHPVYAALGADYESCSTWSRRQWPRLAAVGAFSNDQFLKLQILANGSAQARPYWTDFLYEASSCGGGGHEPCVPVAAMPNALAQLGNRTILVIGDSVSGQLYGFLSCWLLSEAAKAGVSDAAIATESKEWLSNWHAALLERATVLGVGPSHPVVQRASGRTRTNWRQHTVGSAVRIPNGGPTIAFVNNRLSLPPGMTWRGIVAEWYLPMIAADSRKLKPHLSRGHEGDGVKPRTSIVLNYGLHANLDNPDDVKEARGATNDLAGDFANVTSSFLREVFGSSRFSSSNYNSPSISTSPSSGSELQLLVLESVPQHFDTPTGLYVGSQVGWAPCVPIAQPHHPAVNWRNEAMRRGVEQALAGAGAWRTTRGAGLSGDQPPPPSGGDTMSSYNGGAAVRIVPVWRTLAEMSGIDCHAHHVRNPLRTGRLEEAPVHDDIDEQIAAGGHDCTHLSPDALLFVAQALVRAILLDASGRAARRRSWRAGGAAAA